MNTTALLRRVSALTLFTLAATTVPLLGGACDKTTPCCTPAPCTTAYAWKFYFGPSAAPAGWAKINPDTLYNSEVGFGYEAGTSGLKQVDRGLGFTTSEQPFYFSVALPEGSYRVTATLGDPAGASNTTIKAELRRLMVENAVTAPGEITKRTFAVNIRRPIIIPPAGERKAGDTQELASVSLKPRERAEEWRAWDEKLTLEFNSIGPDYPCLVSLEITRADHLPVIYLLGDSTVCDQPREPYASWGQMLTRFFKPDVVIASHAESGESLSSSLGARRLDKVLSLLRPGDTVFIQFGHNDMKAVDVPTYKASLEKFVDAIRTRQGNVVLITPPHRQTFDNEGNIVNSHKGYPDAVREVARADEIPLVDLHAMSALFYEEMGPKNSDAAFKPGDATHHSNYGAYELAKCIVESLRRMNHPLATHVADDLPRFDPAKPDPVDTVKIAPSPTATGTKPDGS